MSSAIRKNARNRRRLFGWFCQEGQSAAPPGQLTSGKKCGFIRVERPPLFRLRRGEKLRQTARDRHTEEAAEGDLQQISRQVDEHAVFEHLPERQSLAEIRVGDQRQIRHADGVEDSQTRQHRERRAPERQRPLCKLADDERGRDQAEQEAERRLQHVGKAAAQREDRHADKADEHVHQLRERAVARAKQNPGHGREQKLQGNGRECKRDLEKGADRGQGGEQGGQDEHQCLSVLHDWVLLL